MLRELYKQNLIHSELQEKRRRKLLEEQKQRRLELQDEQRDLTVILDSKELSQKSSQERRHHKHNFSEIYGCDYSLQLSEWMRTRPADLEEWLLVPCPQGQRCLVVACAGRTRMYNKAGRCCSSFRSLLPGGSGLSSNDRNSVTMLDCVYNLGKDAFYVLDVLSYGNQDLVNCEAQFRFFWLRSKFDESSEPLHKTSAYNEKPFHLLDTYDLGDESLTSAALQKYPYWPDDQPTLDGFLFYHKEASYTCGTTPLVCWLFPFMVPDVLQMEVSASYERPPQYADPLQYMAEFDAQMARKRKRRPTANKITTDADCNSVAEGSQDINTEQENEDNARDNLLDAQRALEQESEVEMEMSEVCLSVP